MIKAVLGVALGAIGALELERRLGRFRSRLSARSITDGFFERLNQRLERERSGGAR